jgi:hypothetical protein
MYICTIIVCTCFISRDSGLSKRLLWIADKVDTLDFSITHVSSANTVIWQQAESVSLKSISTLNRILAIFVNPTTIYAYFSKRNITFTDRVFDHEGLTKIVSTPGQKGKTWSPLVLKRTLLACYFHYIYVCVKFRRTIVLHIFSKLVFNNTFIQFLTAWSCVAQYLVVQDI